MINQGLFTAARMLIPSGFFGLGVERLLIGAGALAGAPVLAAMVVLKRVPELGRTNPGSARKVAIF